MKARVICSHLDAGLRGAADHAGAAIDDVDAVAGDDRGRWTHAVGQGIRIARAEQDDVRILRQQRGGSKRRRQAAASFQA